ncbi:3-hydroxyanthranilate 3,4-dioxygenase-like isoform X1 [Branchiostoma floridae x Branchiostoma belcheri]
MSAKSTETNKIVPAENRDYGQVQPVSVETWLEENEKFFLPPVCNKLMHNWQLKVMFVGGPNQRKDYHIEEGEELFYMVKGDMCLKIVEQGKHKDVVIKEGEVFLLPARIQHSPQRQENTIGLVLERERGAGETDGLRYFVDGTTERLYEKWFHCTDLGAELKPIIEGYFNSTQFKTGKPIPEELQAILPFELDIKTVVMKPFPLKDWIQEHRRDMDEDGGVSMFGEKFQFETRMFGSGKAEGSNATAETWLWQLEGEAKVTVGDQVHNLAAHNSLLIAPGQLYRYEGTEGAVCMANLQDPNRKS